MKILGLIGSFFCFTGKIRSKYERLRNDPEKKDESISLGTYSLSQSIICGFFVVLFILGLYACVKNLLDIRIGNGEYSVPLLTLLGVFVCGISAVVLFVKGIIGSLFYLFYQFKLNKRGIRWVALIA